MFKFFFTLTQMLEFCQFNIIQTLNWNTKNIGGFHVTQVGLIITQVKDKVTSHSINWVKKLKYCWRVIINNVAKFRGCAILRTRVIRQRVSLKIIVFSIETQCWSPSEGLQHGSRKPVETSGVHFGSCRTFLLPVKLENIRIGTSLNILVTKNSKT